MKKNAQKTLDLGFWDKAKKAAAKEKRPILVLAPMADVTDAAFRRIIAKYSRMGQPHGGPDVMWTEFVSADGLCSPGRKVLLNDLIYTEGERPIVAQLFTSNPAKMRVAAELVAKLGFDGLDINMGCPDRSIEKQKSGAAMMKDPENAIAVIEAAREGVEMGRQAGTSFGGLPGEPSGRVLGMGNPGIARRKIVPAGLPFIPVSVKTRIGYNKVEIDTWIRALLEQKLPVLTVHLRTRKEMSDMPAHWELMPEIVKLRDEISPKTLIIGNGDALSLADAKEKAEKSGCDGIMLGRAIFGNPWLFDSKIKRSKEGKIKDEEKNEIKKRLRVLVEHTDLFMELFGDIKSFAVMKKHYKAYVNGWDGAKFLRAKLMETKDASEVKSTVDK
ncbi:MAG: tRNA-dihydrouridine synthase, partial [Candidatus Pacebacteria bacterium]|nr:tRNA-dihydrouridine synthase [Candidatus Paceibacterota bacterium]